MVAITQGDTEVMGYLLKQAEAFETQREELERDHFGKWAMFYDEELVGLYEEFNEAIADGEGRYGDQTFLLREIGVPPMVVRSFMVEVVP